MGGTKRRRVTSPTHRNGIKNKKNFQSIDMVWLVKKSMFESRQNTTVSVAILCLSVRIRDVTNKVGLSGRSIQYVTNQPLSALHWERVSQYGCVLTSSNVKKKKVPLLYT